MRTIRKFRTYRIDTRNKRKFSLKNQSKLPLHVSILSVLNFRICMLTYPASVTHPLHGKLSCSARWRETLTGRTHRSTRLPTTQRYGGPVPRTNTRLNVQNMYCCPFSPCGGWAPRLSDSGVIPSRRSPDTRYTAAPLCRALH